MKKKKVESGRWVNAHPHVPQTRKGGRGSRRGKIVRAAAKHLNLHAHQASRLRNEGAVEFRMVGRFYNPATTLAKAITSAMKPVAGKARTGRALVEAVAAEKGVSVSDAPVLRPCRVEGCSGKRERFDDILCHECFRLVPRAILVRWFKRRGKRASLRVGAAIAMIRAATAARKGI